MEMKALEPKTPWTDMLASSSAHEERFDRTLGLGRRPVSGSRCSAEVAGQPSSLCQRQGRAGIVFAWAVH